MSGGASALPSDEAARMIGELGAAVGKPVRAFALGRDREQAPERLTGLERMGEKIARALRPVFEGLAHARAQVTALPLAIERFDAWRAAQPAFLSLSHYRLAPLKGGMLVAIEPAFVATLLERFYGGGGGDPGAPARRSEFSAGEELLLGRLLDRLVATVVEHWAEVEPVEATLVQRETSTTHLSFVRADDAVVMQGFTVAPLECAPSVVTLVYPLAMLRPIEERMELRVHDDAPAGNAAFRTQLAAALAEVPLPVRSVLARPRITLGELMALKPGDVIPIQLGAHAPLMVAARPIALGQIGERDGRAALMIDRMGRS